MNLDEILLLNNKIQKEYSNYKVKTDTKIEQLKNELKVFKPFFNSQKSYILFGRKNQKRVELKLSNVFKKINKCMIKLIFLFI